MNCKEGDLAVVVKPGDFPKNLGSVVRVLEPCNYRAIIRYGRLWYVKCLASMDSSHGMLKPGEIIVMGDFQLRAICPPAAEQSTKQDQEVAA